MSFTSMSRRRLLSAIAAAGGAYRLGPFVPSAVRAATAPKRILTIFHPMGYLESSFWPTGTGTDYKLGETMTALAPWRSKLLFLDGLALHGPQYFFQFKDNEHGLGAAVVFTGGKYVYTGEGQPAGSDSVSIDQAVADFQYSQVKTPFRSLTLGVNSGGASSHTSVFYSKPTTPVIAQRDAKATFNQLFAGFTGPKAPPTGMSPTPTPTPTPASDGSLERKTKQEQSILNYVKADVGRVRSLAGKEDQLRLDAHLDGISSLENRIKLLSGTSGTTSSPPVVGAPPAPAGSVVAGCASPAMTSGDLQVSVRTQMDLIAAAFACDMTRSASLQLGICDGGMDEAVPGVGQHDTTHAFGDSKGAAPHPENHKKFDRWYAAQWAYLLNKLDSIKEGNGTMLDNTLIVFGSDTTTGDNIAVPGEMGAHKALKFPLWMAGGGAFAFKTGQPIKLPYVNKDPGGIKEVSTYWVGHHRLLTSIGQAFGMNIESFGNNDPGKGGIAQLTRV